MPELFEQQTALEKAEPKALEPMQMVQLVQMALVKAIEQGAPMEAVNLLRTLIDDQNRTELEIRRRRIQDRLKPIVKRGWNESTRSKYALPDDIDAQIDVLLHEENLTLSFETEPHPQPQMVRVVGSLSLVGTAFSKRYPLDMPADGQGPKGGGVMTRTHATGSAVSYGIRYIKRMIFNLRFTEKDDDGNAAGGGSPPTCMDANERKKFVDSIRASAHPGELKERYFAAEKRADEIGDEDAKREFRRVTNEEKRRFPA